MEARDEIEKNEAYLERFTFACGRIEAIYEETKNVNCAVSAHGEAFADYFHCTAGFLLQVAAFYKEKRAAQKEDAYASFQTVSPAQGFPAYTFEQWQALNASLYRDVTGSCYETSYANPAYALERLGQPFCSLLCTLYTELRASIAYAFENRVFYLAAGYELFIEVYNILEQPDAEAEEVKSAIYFHFFDYADRMVPDSVSDTFDPSRNFAARIICDCDLTDLSYLYYFGEYISENELQTAAYLNTLSEKEIQDMAFTFTDGFRRGFALYRLDLSAKRTINLQYRLGMERMMRAVIAQFREMGLSPCLYRDGVSISKRSPRGKTGFFGASPNKQYEYDHLYDDAIFFDKAYADRLLGLRRQALEASKALCADFAGPAVVETFGEAPFCPVRKESAYHYDKKQQGCKLDYRSANGLLTNEYVPGDQTSFSIIAYPLPEIGAHYREIFQETVRVNTLDLQEYQEIQQKIIDALDSGEFVTVTGKNGNRTSIKIALAPLADRASQTRFENCLADVNIPLGEVFTTPQLSGTEGILHVKKTFLNELEYRDITLRFQDGIVTEYHCANFETEEENEAYIRENLLFSHETLPMGEFAIGTNTTAYAMGKKYGISHLLPILIAEKTGPHFAIGDTCYSHEEELITYNPDGKQMIAKENTYSLLRQTDAKKAYFNCHTDITIPYDELGDVCVHKADGTELAIIRGGRFALPGTEALNRALDEIG